jgi:hypothetical protein
LDIIYRPVFNLKQDVSETGFCLRFQLESIQACQTERANLSVESVYDHITFDLLIHFLSVGHALLTDALRPTCTGSAKLVTLQI